MIFDDFRAASASLFDIFGTPATITSSGTPTRDVITGTITAGAPTTRTVKAAMGTRRVKADDGTIHIQTTAKLNGTARDGDRLTIGTATYTVMEVETVAPDGGAPMIYIVTLK